MDFRPLNAGFLEPKTRSTAYKIQQILLTIRHIEKSEIKVQLKLCNYIFVKSLTCDHFVAHYTAREWDYPRITEAACLLYIIKN